MKRLFMWSGSAVFAYTGLRRVQDVDHDAAQTENIWVPIALPAQAMKYLNPVTGETLAHPPRHAVLAKVATVTGYMKPAFSEDVKYGKPGEQLLPDDVRQSCVPHCTWNCTQPVCEQDCEPDCKAGQCETRCPKMSKDQLDSCHVQCSEPDCSMYCPKKDLCEGKKTLDCETRPKCSTRCQEPKCNFVCNNDLGDACKTVCPDPVCTFKCKKPKVCPNPQCNLVCEKPPDCDTHPTLPPPKDGETIVGSGAANDGLARFESGPWGQCSSTCGSGAQARDVHCNTHHDEDCEGLERPSTSRPCQDYSGCQYATSEWSQCSARCGPGTQTRRVGCAGKRCTGKAPLSSQRCDGDAPECHSCNAVVFGGPNFDGWSLEFGPGEYTVADMEAKGAKCDDISSMKVYGLFCRVAVFQFGDFNGAYSGWQANFGPGFYDREKLVDGGARDNDISSLRVSRIGGVPSANFSNPFRNGSNPLGNGTNPFGNSSSPFGGKNGMGWNPFGSAAPLAVLFPLAIALVS
mmetsp:Transcript_8442/g.18489  ORF Transcript_8442/g.18489 Transcript_8442/m.18489 type:complete len:517 (+) Transcript_8442:133-1683(+)